MNLRRVFFSLFLSGAVLILIVFVRVAHPLGNAEIPTSQPVLVELFTSEGCSSCPPADRVLAELDRRQDVRGASVVVLSEHVDYWNHLGWRDPYSLAQWSQRQSAYARQFQLDSVYTPQAVVDGSRQVLGSDANDLRAAIVESSHRRKIDVQIVSVSRRDHMLEAQITAGAAQNAVLYAVVADARDQSSVARGENAGRQLEHVAVARTLAALTPMHGDGVNQKFQIAMGLSVAATPSVGGSRLVVFIQDRNGLVLGIASRSL